jgi:hypothetical protein
MDPGFRRDDEESSYGRHSSESWNPLRFYAVANIKMDPGFRRMTMPIAPWIVW